MKKTAIAVIATLLAVSLAQAASDTFFFGSGASGADVVIAKGAGTISAQDVLLSIETNATVTVHRGKVSTTASVASSGTAVVIATASSNTVNNITLTTSDYLIIGDEFRGISALSPASANSTTVTVSAAASVQLGETVYVCDAGDQVSLAARTTWGNYPIPFLFRGFNNAPAAISVPSTAGATMVSGRAVRD